jgi:hypothetical protein
MAFALPATTALHSAKGIPQDDVLWETWNRLSRVTVQTEVPGYDVALRLLTERMDEDLARETLDRWRIGWGMSSGYSGPVPEMRWVLLDSDAGTQIIKDGALDFGAPLEFLEWDVTTLAHFTTSGLSSPTSTWLAPKWRAVRTSRPPPPPITKASPTGALIWCWLSFQVDPIATPE